MKLMFICSTSTQVQTFVPVAERFCNTGHPEILWVSLDGYYGWDASRELQSLGINYTAIGTSFHGQILAYSIVGLYWSLLTSVQSEVVALLRASRPDVLFVGNDRGLVEKALIKSAKCYGCKTVLIQDGLLWKTEVRRFTSLGLSANYARNLAKELLRRLLFMLNLQDLAPTYIGEGKCDLIAVMGIASKNVLLARGVDSKKLFVTGQPRYDGTLQNLLSPTEEQFVEDNKRVIAIFTTAFQTNLRDAQAQREQQEFAFKLCSHSLEKKSNFHFIVKPHPREQLDGYEPLQQLPNVEVKCHIDSISILRVADLVISTVSTVIAEAALLQKPLLVLQIGHIGDVSEALGLPPKSFNVIGSKLSIKEISSIIDHMLVSPQESTKYAASLVHTSPDGASAAIVSLLTNEAS